MKWLIESALADMGRFVAFLHASGEREHAMEQKIPEMRAITISRQYGSGGGEIAAHLARYLGWQLIDHEIVAQVAHSLGITEEEADVHDERVEGFIVRA